MDVRGIEAGANPRDTEEETEGRHGMTGGVCRALLEDAGWRVLEGPSRWYTDPRFAPSA